MKHPYNCETCKNREINCNDDRFCKVTGDEISFIEEDFTSVYGCASHSNAQSEQVLNAVMSVVNQYIPFGDSPTAIMVREIEEAKEKAKIYIKQMSEQRR
jgi:hypothetical protein